MLGKEHLRTPEIFYEAIGDNQVKCKSINGQIQAEVMRKQLERWGVSLREGGRKQQENQKVERK